MAAAFGVSRPAFREALVHLRARGLIETVNGTGTFVRRPEVSQLADALLRHLRLAPASENLLGKLYEVRTTIEVSAAEEAARSATDDDVAGIARHLAVMRESGDDPEAYASADVAFHLAVADAAHNPFLPPLLSPLIQVVHHVIGKQHSADAVAAGIRAHERIIREVRAHRPERAGAAMRRHLGESMSRLRATSPQD